MNARQNKIAIVNSDFCYKVLELALGTVNVWNELMINPIFS